MSADITQLLSPTLVFMLLCYFVTLFFRKLMEARWPRLRFNDDWKSFILPIIPAILGLAFAYIPKYPIPAIFIASPWSKGVWGLVAGIISTWAYSILQALVKKVFGVDINLMKSIRPGPIGDPSQMIPPPPPMATNLTTDVQISTTITTTTPSDAPVVRDIESKP